MQACLSYLYDPEIFQVGRLPAASDHDTYLNRAEAEAQKSGLVLPLDGTWRVRMAKGPEDLSEGFEADGFAAEGWEEIRVPGCLETQGFLTPQYVNIQYPWDGHEELHPNRISEKNNPAAEYLRLFSLPADFVGRRARLRFEGAATAIYVWLNGKFLGYAEDSFTSSEFDASSALRPGENRLCVRLFRFSSASWIEDQDFWRFSGLFRSVSLRAEGEAHTEDIFIRTPIADDWKRAKFQADLRLRLPERPVKLKAELLDPTGARALYFETEAKENLRLEGEVENPRLWSAESPDLYTFRLSLLDGERELELAQTRAGFRRFEIRDGVMLLNGARVEFHGVNRHEFDARMGRTLSDEDLLSDIRFLKRNNVNAVRTCHYPNDSRWYRLCDEYGIYLIDETNIESHGSWTKYLSVNEADAVPCDREEWQGAVNDRGLSMLERDKNHPCVLIWSCGNESYGGKVLYNLSNLLRERDGTRPVHYEGVNNDRRYNDTSDIESRMYTRIHEIKAYLLGAPKKPYILCEYAHAMGNALGDLFKYAALWESERQFQGGFIWDMIDQAIETKAPSGARRLAYGGDFGDRPSDRHFCANGLLFADRTESPKVQEMRYLYQNVKILPERGGVLLENRNLFADLSAYELRWTLKREGAPLAAGTLMADVAPGTERFVPIALPADLPAGEYVVRAALCHRAACAWAEAGYEQMAGECVFAVAGEEAPGAPAGTLNVEAGNVNVGAYGNGRFSLYSIPEGGLISYKKEGGPELIAWPPRPSFFRASTDTDRGGGFDFDAALWRIATEAAHPREFSHAASNGALRVDCRWALPAPKGASVTISYEALPDGGLRLCLRIPPMPEEMGVIPAVGLMLRMPREFDRVRYYGLGPEENYIDRLAGARLDVFETTAEKNLTPYVVPQECGNRAGVRWMEITNEKGRGLRVEADGSPLEMRVLPYTASELENALHPDELPPRSYTAVDIASVRMGVGGDDGWGSKTHPEFTIPCNVPHEMRCVLRAI